MKEEMFVLKNKFYNQLEKKLIKKYSIESPFVNLQWHGKKIIRMDALIDYAIIEAKKAIFNLPEIQEILTKKVKEICKQYNWIKDKKLYSRCGKWIKKEITNV